SPVAAADRVAAHVGRGLAPGLRAVEPRAIGRWLRAAGYQRTGLAHPDAAAAARAPGLRVGSRCGFHGPLREYGQVAGSAIPPLALPARRGAPPFRRERQAGPGMNGAVDRAPPRSRSEECPDSPRTADRGPPRSDSRRWSHELRSHAQAAAESPWRPPVQ